MLRQFLATVLMLCCVPIAAANDTLSYDEVKAIFAGQTAMSYDSTHGTQVEYLSTTGSAYLLYPGNTTIVKGQWRLNRTDEQGVFNLCFRYPGNSYNPATGQAGGQWECQIAGFYYQSLAELKAGDFLGLARSSTPPFILSPKKTTIMELITQRLRSQ
jgi:hypothetical protein